MLESACPTSTTKIKGDVRFRKEVAEKGGFHCFRRFRESVLQMSDARNLLVDYWMGHENREMGTRYAKQLIENIQWRKEWAEKIGLGFKLPTLESSVGLLGLPKQQKSKLEKVA